MRNSLLEDIKKENESYKKQVYFSLFNEITYSVGLNIVDVCF
jgi:hypothetical protein